MNINEMENVRYVSFGNWQWCASQEAWLKNENQQAIKFQRAKEKTGETVKSVIQMSAVCDF